MVNKFRYALVNRPPMVGGLPSRLAYEVEPRPFCGQPHHDMARHGVLVTERALTDDELYSYELAPLLDTADLGPLVERIVADMAGGAKEYVEVQQDDPESFAQWVCAGVRRVSPRVHCSVGDPDALVSQVLERLTAVAGDAQTPQVREGAHP